MTNLDRANELATAVDVVYALSNGAYKTHREAMRALDIRLDEVNGMRLVRGLVDELVDWSIAMGDVVDLARKVADNA